MLAHIYTELKNCLLDTDWFIILHLDFDSTKMKIPEEQLPVFIPYFQGTLLSESNQLTISRWKGAVSGYLQNTLTR